ncbi:hypothetical protein V1477_007265 [Vespula maculifrons]|uniref:Uncharacterized protein n=1 Tax=Vespula maculifrons TaxID=7453 RepID=A0ABD2CKM3_VESMC
MRRGEEGEKEEEEEEGEGEEGKKMEVEEERASVVKNMTDETAMNRESKYTYNSATRLLKLIKTNLENETLSGRLANEAAGGSRDGSGDVEGCCGTNGGCLHYSYALAIPPAPPFQVETPGTGASIAAGTTIAAVAAVAAGAAAAAAPGHANTNFRTPRRRTKSTYGIVELGENINTNVKDQEKHGPTKVTFIYRDVCLFFCELWYYPTNVETDVQTANVAESAFTILSVRSDDGSL